MTQEKRNNNLSKPLLNSFYDLASYQPGNRNSAILKLISEIEKSKDSIPYCLERLVKGTASPRENARLGFSVALTELLKSSQDISGDDVLAIIEKHLSTKAGENAKNNAIGRILSLMAIIRSKKGDKGMEKIVSMLNEAIIERPYLELAWSQAIISLLMMADDESFRTIVWPSVKSHCNAGLEKCTPASLWIILEMDKFHQKYARKKVKLLRDGNWPPIDEKQFMGIGEIVAAGVRGTPAGIHPLEKSLLSTMMISNDTFELFWNHTVNGYLIKNDDKMVSSAGIRMIGTALKMNPNKNQLKHILSIDTLKQLLKSLLDRRPAARFSRTVAWTQLDSIHDYVLANKANPAVQFMTLKKIFDVSLNFDSVSGSNLIYRLIGTLSEEAASMATEDLIIKLNSPHAKENGHQSQENLQSSEFLTAVKLLHRIFECAKFSSTNTPPIYRSTILKLLADAAFMKPEYTELPKSLSMIASNLEIVKNIFMRCLDSLCDMSGVQRPNRPKFEFTLESITIMGQLIDTLIDKKQKRLSDKCTTTLKPDQEKLVIKATKLYHQISKLASAVGKEGDGMASKGFCILIGYTLLWFISEPEAYYRTLEDLLSCWEESQEPTKSSKSTDLGWTDVLIDLLLGLLSRPHRHIRTPLQVAFHYFCPQLNLENIQPLLKALKPSETENLITDDDNEQDEMEEETDAPMEEEANKDVWSSSGEESEVEEDENANDVSVDPEFRRAIEDALGDAAIHSDTESTASDWTDEAMMKLDVSLAAVFRSHLTSGALAKKSYRDLAEQAQAFRVRCFDLIFVLLHSQPSAEVLTGILLPLLNVANEAVRISDQKNVFHRSRQVIERIVQTKTTPTMPNDLSATKFLSDISNTIKELIEFTRTICTNPSIQLLASECLRFLLKFGDIVTEKEAVDVFEMEIRNLFAQQLNEYLKDRACLTPTCIFVAAFQKRPRLFVENLSILMEAVFDENVRPFRRHEACTLIHCLLNKDALTTVKDKSDKKAPSSWKRFVDCLHNGVLEMISKQAAEDEQKEENDKEGKKSIESPSSSVLKSKSKSGDIFEIFTLLRAVANLRDVVPLRNLQEASFMEELGKAASSKIGEKKMHKGTSNQGRRRMKLSTLCNEITKKLRPATSREDDSKINDEGEEKEKLTSPIPLKRRKVKT